MGCNQVLNLCELRSKVIILSLIIFKICEFLMFIFKNIFREVVKILFFEMVFWVEISYPHLTCSFTCSDSSKGDELMASQSEARLDCCP